MNRTKIEWSQFTSNPIRAFSLVDPTKKGHHCKKISPGCAHCYSDHLQASMYFGLPPFDKQFLNENVGIYLDENELQRLLKRRKPATVFLGDMTDIFQEAVPFEWLDKIFAVAALNQNLTLQILTKRAERMREYFDTSDTYRDDLIAMRAKELHTSVSPFRLPSERVFDASRVARGERWKIVTWPLPNVHLGVSVENPDYLWRLDHLKETPAAVRFASLEPLLADLGDISSHLRIWRCEECGDAHDHVNPRWRFNGKDWEHHHGYPSGHLPTRSWRLLDWVIVGGESGPGARPCEIAWIRSIVAQCRAANVPVFVKQLGSKPYQQYGLAGMLRRFAVSGKGGDPSEWPDDLRVREMPR